MLSPSLQYLTFEKIDKVKWDHCIAHAKNERIYAYSEFLDLMAEKWDALIVGDYQWVMPVISKKKWGYTYIYQPAFTAQLGIFGNEITPELEALFLNYLNQHFHWIEMDLNSGNTILQEEPFFIERKNYVLPLQYDYEILVKKYRPFIRKKIQHARNEHLFIDDALNYNSMMQVVNAHPFHKKTMPLAVQQKFQNLYHNFHQKKKAFILGVRNPQQQLLSIAVFFFSRNRYYYLLAASSEEGKKSGASHFLIDYFIQTHAGENCMLDFEGSDKKELAFFYNSFGAVLESYPAIRKNELGWFVKTIKKLKQLIRS